MLEKVEGTGGLELFRDARRKDGEIESKKDGGNVAVGRTKVEDTLEGYKGVGSATKKFKEDALSK